MLLLVSVAAYAAALDPASTLAADPTTVIPVEAQNAILALFLKLALAHPWVGTVLVLMALSRVWAKPLFTVVHTLVDLTPSPRDNGILNSIIGWFTNTASGRFAAYLIDWVTSIKIVSPRK